MNTDIKTAGTNTEMAMVATDLTQLSSREQLSALMDGALSADETRFLLRRLQHDGSLAECWERWRLSGEVMRGLAPAQRLPADFALRVAAALHGADAREHQAITAVRKQSARTPGWLRWGGGAAMAASLAVVAFMTQPIALEVSGNLPNHMVEAATDAAPSLANGAMLVSEMPVPKSPAPQAPVQDPTGTGLESQTAALASAVAAVARPTRNNRRGGEGRMAQAVSILTPSNDAQAENLAIAAANNLSALVPQSDIITRPWPRSVFPHDGNTGITVGFSDSTRNTMPYNPFKVRRGIGDLPPALIIAPPAGDAATPTDDETRRGSNSEPQS